MKIFHYIAVASCFPPWRRAFWLALFHDAIEDGWARPRTLRRWLGASLAKDVVHLSRFPGKTYAEYIDALADIGGDVVDVKVADLTVNYRRAPQSLRKRYAKALARLA